MGIMTLADFQSDVRKALGRTVDDTRLTRWLNQSMEEFGYALKFHELEATLAFNLTVGQESYVLKDLTSNASLPDFRVMSDSGVEVTAPSDCLGRLLSETRVSWRLHRDTSDDTTKYGAPTHYHIYGDKLWIRPKPDVAYTLEFDYWAKITPLVGTDDVSPFKSDWDDIIMTGALWRAMRATGMMDRYKNVRNDYLAGIRSRVADEDLEEFPVGGISLAQTEYDDVVR